MEYTRKNWLKILSVQLLLGVAAFFVFQQFFPAKMDKVVHVVEERVAVEEPEIPLPPPIKYSLVASQDTLKWLESLQPGDTLMALMVLNRTDGWRLKYLDTLVFPDTIISGIESYAPFPKHIDELEGVNKILFVSHHVQAFAVYEKGERIKWGPVSLGTKYKPTPTGLFATNWKSKKTISTINSSWILEWYCNIDNHEGIGMHLYVLPGYPASHGCVRLYRDDANWLYHWADQWVVENGKVAIYGTPVVIFGEYPYGQKKPWLQMAEEKKGLEITPAVLKPVLDEYLPTIMERQAKRDSLESTQLLTDDD